MMGHRQVDRLRCSMSSRSKNTCRLIICALHRQVRRVGGREAGTGSIIQHNGPAIDRSRADDLNTDRGLLLWNPSGVTVSAD